MTAVRGSPVAAWTLYTAIGALGTLAIVTIACDGKKRANDAPPPPKPNASAKVTATPSPDAAPSVAGDTDAMALPHSVHDDLGGAFEYLLRDQPRVLGVGELHLRTDKAGPTVSALARFTNEAMPKLGTRVSDLVIETWLVDPTCKTGMEATQRVEGAMKRPESTKSEIGALVGIIKQNGIKAHVMRLTCDDLNTVAPAAGVDAEKLLDVVTRELGRVTRSAVRYRDEHAEARPLIVVFGGALHNDLYPFDSTKQWSYAKGVDEATSGHFVEVDLYLPELVEGQALYEAEDWYPLVAKAPPGKVLLVERAPHSWLAILPRS
ncbi:MAG TPA: hypothetical protein VM261_39220 [Kofleriaceae bacterium]|nr:hypothetical protein [Kofleriaceae bacterium]